MAAGILATDIRERATWLRSWSAFSYSARESCSTCTTSGKRIGQIRHAAEHQVASRAPESVLGEAAGHDTGGLHSQAGCGHGIVECVAHAHGERRLSYT